MRRFLLTSLSGWLLISCSWFCLWVISYYFVNDPELAILFFPFALRLGITLHTSPRFWACSYIAEWLLTIALAMLLEQPQWLTILGASLLSIPVTWLTKRYYFGTQWRRLVVMSTVILSTAFINVLAVSSHVSSIYMVWLVSITGGLMLVPSCYLIWNYLFQSTWIPLTSNLISRPIQFQIRPVVLFSLLFSASIALQIGLPDELRRFAPFCLAIPIILLAVRYGWQGALLGTLLNSIALIAARSGVSQLEITDLLLSLSAQTLTGILLGMTVQRQRDLNQQLRNELSRNQSLSRQLVKAEESVRKEVARELHDEIGQNITAIRTQASIIKRVETNQMGVNCADTIESLSLNVYDTTKGLLTRLRPKTLDDLNLVEAIEQLIREMEFEHIGTDVTIEWQGDSDSLNDATSVTLYRLCQEALNNAQKYAHASHIRIMVCLSELVVLDIKDNGIGFKPQDSMKGLGLRGMQERVQALGGRFSIVSHTTESAQPNGTHIRVQIPRI